jgi:hypothetical protein
MRADAARRAREVRRRLASGSLPACGDVGYLRCMSHLHHRTSIAIGARARAMLAVLLVALGLLAGCSEDTKLKVTDIQPKRGDFNGGQLARIIGNRFTKDGARNVKVYFGSRQATVQRFDNDNEIIVQVPGGTPNETVDVLVIFDGYGEVGLKKAYTFVEPDKVDVEDLGTKK